MQQLELPFAKLCECGCGLPAPISPCNSKKYDYIKGQPRRFVQGHHNKVRKMRPLAARFWEKVDKRGPDECWPWIAALDNKGYGVMGKRRKVHRAHRVGWEVVYGPIPDGAEVCRECDNPPCCNPAHWFLGTHADNMADMAAKGRNFTGERPRGEQHGNSKLTEEKVQQIRLLKANRISPADIAKQFEVSISTVYAVVTYEVWKHI